MDHLYAPWRTAYLNGKSSDTIDECVFCHISQNPEEDEQQHVFFRDEHCFAVMNRFPYSPGHFMIIPHMHTGKLEELDSKVWLHLSSRVQQSVNILKEYGAHGTNIGMNLEKCAGAGIPEHLHYHVVPRFFPDTNFISTIGQTRVYGTDFEEVYQKIKHVASKYFI